MPLRSSSLTWLVFSDSDIQEARRLIDEMDNSDATIDILGFGGVLESLSEIFFPATSTLHRRIRYQIFIPALVWFLQRQKQTPDARLALKNAEYDLQRALVDSGETLGVIGRSRKEALKYWPSILYWNATNKLQMFGPDTTYSMDEVFRILQDRGGILVNDDKETESAHSATDTKTITLDPELAGIAEALFDKNIEKLRRSITFDLTKPEALYLKKKFQSLFPRSLTSYLLEQTARSIARIDSLFTITSTPDEERNELIRQAEQFSRFAMGATYAYRWVLCEHLRAHAVNRSSDEKLAQFRDRAEKHFERWRKESRQVHRWTFSELVSAADSLGTDLADPKLEEFQRGILHAAHSGGPARHAFRGLQKIISYREYQIKGNSSRFVNQNISIPKNTFEEDYGGNALFDYRWGRIGKRNALDIVSALEGAK